MINISDPFRFPDFSFEDAEARLMAKLLRL